MRLNTETETAVRAPLLSPSELIDFDRILSSRARHLRIQVREELQRRHTATAEALADQVRRVEEDLDADVSLAGLEREIQELRDIAAARGRVVTGRFGICTDCGEPIGKGRLTAYPTAKRCIDCQGAHERARPGPALHTM